MHAAQLTSPRLQRVLAILADGRPHTTREISRNGDVYSVSSCIAELRTHGAVIGCIKRKVRDNWQFFYTMTKGPRDG